MMKNIFTKRNISIIASILVVLIFAPLILFFECRDVENIAGTLIEPAKTAEQQQSYIEDLKLAGAYWNRYASNATGELNKRFSNYNYRKVQDFNLNRDCGTTTDCIYLYESRTYDKAKAITNIISVCQDKETYNYFVTDQFGIEYEIVGGIRINGLKSSISNVPIFDLNMGAGGKYIYIYATKDTRIYEPITEIEILNYYKSLSDGWSHVSDKNDVYKAINFNEGAGGSKIYINFSNIITGWEIFNLYLEDYDVNGTKQIKEIKLELYDKRMTKDILKPYVEKDEYSHFYGYSYNDGTMVQIDDEIKYDNQTIRAEWFYDITLDMSLFGLDDIVMNSVQKATELPKYDIDGYHMLGWHFENENTITINTWLNHGGVLVPLMERAHVKDFENFMSGLQMMQLFSEKYQMSTMYHLIIKSDGNPFIRLGFDTALYMKGLAYKNGTIEQIEITKTLVSSSIDYSSLSEEEQVTIESHRLFLLLCDGTSITNMMDYYLNEGKSESIIDEVLVDLCKKEKERR